MLFVLCTSDCLIAKGNENIRIMYSITHEMHDIINLSNSIPLTRVHDSITNKETILCEKIGHVQQNVFI